jgi:hypothetical protein
MPKKFHHIDSQEPPYWVYLNLRLPYVRWNTALGKIYPASYDPENGARHLSMFASQRLKKGIDYFNFEQALEEERAKKYPHKISRLQGLFVFDTQEEAKKAETLWGKLDNQFQPYCLSEATCEIGHNKSKHDSNWLTYYRTEFPSNWKELYWEGVAYPHQEPVWETIVDRPLLLWNTQLRQSVSDRLHDELRCSFLLRLGILACDLGYELGRNSITLLKENDCLQVRHMICFEKKLAIEVVEEIKRTKPEYMSALRWPQDKDIFVPDLSSSDFCITHRCTPKECNNTGL